MPKIKIIVWHTLTGEIVAIGRLVSESEAIFLGGANQAVLVTKIDEELLGGLHRTHVVDLDRKALARRE